MAEFTYDVYGYPKTVTRHVSLAGGGTAPITAETQYDSLGNLMSATDPSGNVTRYEYDPASAGSRTRDGRRLPQRNRPCGKDPGPDTPAAPPAREVAV